MYFVSVTCLSKDILIVPSFWVYNFDVDRSLNHGIDKTDERLIFYSEHQNRKANFFAPIKKKFRSNIDCCYKAKIIKAFGKRSVLLNHVLFRPNLYQIFQAKYRRLVGSSVNLNGRETIIIIYFVYYFLTLLSLRFFFCLLLDSRYKAVEFASKKRNILPVNYKVFLGKKKQEVKSNPPHEFIDKERQEYICKLYDIVNYLGSAEAIGLFDDDEINEIRNIVDVEGEFD